MASFLSGRFLAFVAAALLGYWLLPRRLRPWGLAAANLAYLALLLGPSGGGAVLALVVMTHVFTGRQAAAPPGRRGLWTGAGIGILVAGFLVDRLWLRPDGASGWDAGAAGGLVGYSFLAFRLIQALLLGHAGNLPPGSFLDFLNFAVFFPSFTAGPIDSIRRWREEGAASTPDAGLLAHGLSRILTGLVKKHVLVPVLTPFTLAAFPDPAAIPSAGAAWLLTAGLTVLVWLDFSGYSDIAIGLGRCLGYRLPENFDRPLLRRDLVGFWEGWHMSLTGWLRQHVFVPLTLTALAQGLPERAATVLSTIATMMLVGLWHGFSWGWALFGALHAAALLALRAWEDARPRLLGPAGEARWRASRLAAAGGALLTFLFVALTVSLVVYPLPAFLDLLARCGGAR